VCKNLLLHIFIHPYKTGRDFDLVTEWKSQLPFHYKKLEKKHFGQEVECYTRIITRLVGTGVKIQILKVTTEEQCLLDVLR